MKRFRTTLFALSVCTLMSLVACTPREDTSSRFLYVWAGDKDEKDSDFMAVVDIRPSSATYADVIATEPVGVSGSLPHHMEYQLPDSGSLLFVNGHHHETIFLFDTRNAEHPRLVRQIMTVAPYRYPHDMVRKPNGVVLVGYLRSDGPSPLAGDSTLPGGSGGIAELDSSGSVRRAISAADSSIKVPIRPYSFALLPGIDRMVMTSAPMMEDTSADVVQIWQLTPLKRLQTIQLPPARLASGGVLPRGHAMPFEPRLMEDGSVLLNAYGCGFFRVTDIGADSARIENVYTIDIPSDQLGSCGVPVVEGRYWVMSVGALHSLVTLDITDPAHPREVSRLFADSVFRPHWLAKDPGSDRIVVGAENGGESRMLMARLDARTGKLSWDETFKSKDGLRGVSFVRTRWPHGETGEAFGHAALFRR